MRRTSWGERPSRQIGPANGSTYFWAACPGQALNLDVIQRCRHILLSHDELNGHQEALVDVKSSISKSGWGEWNQQSLIRKGFTVLNQPTIVAVAVPDGRRAVQFVFLPRMPYQRALANLSHHLFDNNGKREARKTRGQTLVKRRGDKHMSGCMMMYGIKSQPHNAGYAKANGLCCTLAPCLYNVGTPVNAKLEHLWQQHLREFSNLERLHVPACAEQRKTIADGVDPGKSYRISRHCDAFACSMSKNFTIGPHDDSGICESVMFINRQGRPPKGTRHEWAFAVAGHILILPETKDECALVYLRGNGLWHGTLPTSYRHVNAGSALVTKALTIDTMRRHGQGCSHGPSWRM